MITFLLIANFFVEFHIKENGIDVYTFRAVQHNREYSITYVGKPLPVDDRKKFYAEMKVECLAPIVNVAVCEAVSIKF